MATMHRHLLRRALVGITATACVVVGSPAVAGAHPGAASVVPVDQSAYGHTYGEWSARWWQWSYSLPTTHHPLFDTASCRAGQSGKVWFLGGTFTLVQQGNTVVGEAERSCNVPAGKALFFPILNSEWDNVCPPVDPPLSVPELRQAAAASLAEAQGLAATIDGASVPHLVDFRATSPVFSVTIPNKNVWKSFGPPCDTIKAGTYRPIVADGWYLLVKPLSHGRHTIHFEGAIPGFRLDITYHLNVG
jgi:hypothetical protein